MGHAVERDLLDIEVPEEEKVPLFIDDEGQEHDSRRQQRNAEGQQPSGHLAACGLCVDLCLFRLHGYLLSDSSYSRLFSIALFLISRYSSLISE